MGVRLGRPAANVMRLNPVRGYLKESDETNGPRSSYQLLVQSLIAFTKCYAHPPSEVFRMEDGGASGEDRDRDRDGEKSQIWRVQLCNAIFKNVSPSSQPSLLLT